MSAKAEAGAPNPWLIAIVVSIAVFMEVLDTTIANVALPYIGGGLAVSVDEASWAVTTYLVANAAILTASSSLAKMFGRKPFYLASVSLFAVSSVLCGFAWDLQSLLFFRVLQGLGGGGMVPISQSILADSFPPAKRGQAFALVRRRRRGRAGDRPDVGRLAVGQLGLAVVLPDQRAGRPSVDRAGVDAPARTQGPPSRNAGA